MKQQKLINLLIWGWIECLQPCFVHCLLSKSFHIYSSRWPESHSSSYECLLWSFPWRKLPAETKGKPGCNCWLRIEQTKDRASPHSRSGSDPLVISSRQSVINPSVNVMSGLTCDFSPGVSMSSSVLQQEIIVGSVRHPELQSVFQHDFFRSDPHPHSHSQCGSCCCF